MLEILKPFLASTARHALTVAGGYLVAHGVINQNGTEQFVAAGMTLAGVGWSWWEKYGKQQTIADLKNARDILSAKLATAAAAARQTPQAATPKPVNPQNPTTAVR